MLLTIDGLSKADLAPDTHLNLEFSLAHDTTWASAGHVVATGQLQLTKPIPLSLLNLSLSSPSFTTKATQSRLKISSTTGSVWEFDLASGKLTTWKRPSDPRSNILASPLDFSLYRAQTDNDSHCDFGRNWNWRRLHQAKTHLQEIEWNDNDKSSGDRAEEVTVNVKSRIAPPVMNWGVEVTTTYRFFLSSPCSVGEDKQDKGTTQDVVSVKAHFKPVGNLLPRAWGRLGLVLTLAGGVDKVKWFGRGPGETYRDSKMSQLVGNWETMAGGVDELETVYEFPQDNGNRTDVRWVEFLGGGHTDLDQEGGKERLEEGKKPRRLLRARYGDLEGASFQALRYTTADLDKATHPYELASRRLSSGRVEVHLDWMHHGLGTGSCGPETLDEYTLHAGRERDVEILLD